jgi:uncharacterized protein (TIGR00251 family)
MISPVAAAEVRVRVVPGATRDELRSTTDGGIVVRVTAPAREGRANKAVCQLLAKRLRIAPSNVTIVRGARSREKLIRIAGIDDAAVRAGLGLPD